MTDRKSVLTRLPWVSTCSNITTGTDHTPIEIGFVSPPKTVPLWPQRIWLIYFVIPGTDFSTKLHHPKLYPSHYAEYDWFTCPFLPSFTTQNCTPLTTYNFYCVISGINVSTNVHHPKWYPFQRFSTQKITHLFRHSKNYLLYYASPSKSVPLTPHTIWLMYFAISGLYLLYQVSLLQVIEWQVTKEARIKNFSASLPSPTLRFHTRSRPFVQRPRAFIWQTNAKNTTVLQSNPIVSLEWDSWGITTLFGKSSLMQSNSFRFLLSNQKPARHSRVLQQSHQHSAIRIRHVA